MITKNNIISGVVCGSICVAFMAVYAYLFPMNMETETLKNEKPVGAVSHKMPNGQMMTSGGMMNMGESDMKTMMGDMLSNMKGKTGEDLEKAFIKDMIPHHQGAVDMAKLLLQDKTISPQLQKFAQDIITAQESEIGVMNLWLKSY
jgi:uncharacterized protein (DUF305 family)